MRTEEHHAIHLKDYRPNDYRIDEIALTFELDMGKTRVTAISEVVRQGAADAPLVLNGEFFTFVSAAINGTTLKDGEYKKDEKSLTIPKVPERFTLHVVTEFSPAENTALSGLYKAGEIFCTQCEAEGFRRIT